MAYRIVTARDRTVYWVGDVSIDRALNEWRHWQQRTPGTPLLVEALDDGVIIPLPLIR